MKVLREILNVIIGFVVMIALIIGPMSIMVALNNGRAQEINEALISNSLLVVALVIAYFLNKPKSGFVVQRFYKAKWLTALSTLFVTVFSLVIFHVANLVVGLAVSLSVLVLVLKFFVGHLWRCPACQTKLPYLSRGNSGFSIKECPNCKTVLTES